MDTLRWILLAVGALVVAGIYLHWRWQEKRPVNTRLDDSESTAKATRKKFSLIQHKKTTRQVPSSPDREMLLVLHIVAIEGMLGGLQIVRVLEEAGLEYGDMQIFYRPCKNKDENIPLFSVANIVKPGTFDLSRMEGFFTAGLSMFMRLPGPVEPLAAVNEFLEKGHEISAALNAQLQDEQHSTWTMQTEQRMREEVAEFVRGMVSETG